MNENSLQPSQSNNDYHPQLDGLGGWLIILAISILISPIILSYTIIDAISELRPLWEPLTSPQSPYYIDGLATLVTTELTVNALFTLLFLYIIFLFFTKHRHFPKFLIFALAANLLFLLVDDFWVKMILSPYTETDDPEDLRDILLSGIRCVIWIPYLLNSKRVKSTFRH